MPNVEANNMNVNSKVERNVCEVNKLQFRENKQTKSNTQEFASEVHVGADLETYESANTSGDEKIERHQRPVSERTAWN
ncbi:MAG TPA: hypothetical protein VNS08_08570 [Ureibacillus sp.]|nr:hypothetical protein [Ureibacillus sp.]